MTLTELATRLRSAYDKLHKQDPELSEDQLWEYVAKNCVFAMNAVLKARRELPQLGIGNDDHIVIGRVYRGEAERYPYRMIYDNTVHRVTVHQGVYYTSCGEYIKRPFVDLSPEPVTCIPCLASSDEDMYPNELHDPVGRNCIDRWIP